MWTCWWAPSPRASGLLGGTSLGKGWGKNAEGILLRTLKIINVQIFPAEWDIYFSKKALVRSLEQDLIKSEPGFFSCVDLELGVLRESALIDSSSEPVTAVLLFFFFFSCFLLLNLFFISFSHISGVSAGAHQVPAVPLPQRRLRRLHVSSCGGANHHFYEVHYGRWRNIDRQVQIERVLFLEEPALMVLRNPEWQSPQCGPIFKYSGPCGFLGLVSMETW